MKYPHPDYLTWEANVAADSPKGTEGPQWPVGMIEEIATFLRDVHPSLPPGLDFYPEVFATQLFFPLQRQQELARMMRIARSISPKIVMEIGADKGGGLYHWCQCLPSVEHVVACEVRGLPYHHLFDAAFSGLRFTWMPFSSREYTNPKSSALAARLYHPIDCLFIDGDKSAFEQDFDAYLPLMNPKGVVFFHDIQDGPTGAAYWNVVRQGYAHEEILDLTDTQWALSQEREGKPPVSPHEAWLRHWRGRSCGVGVVYLDELKRRW